jgi:aspartyl-tRNA(Asn)/glutamyl-tRNA(Gln) amidotransferase subunit A
MMRLSALGHRVVPITLPASLLRLQELNGTIVAFEAWQHFHQQASDPSSPMDPHVRKRVLAGRDVDETKYRALLEEIAEMTKSFAQAQADVDAILLPGTPIPAAGLETVDQDEIPLSRYTRMANTLDLCAIAIPVGATPEGAPLGIQLCAPWGQDSRLLAVAEKLEPGFADLYIPLATS